MTTERADGQMAMGVYAIRHKETGRAYIGSSANVMARWKHHRARLDRGRHWNPSLQHDWTFFGCTAFEWVILDIASDVNALLTAEYSHLQRQQETTGGAYNVKNYSTTSVPTDKRANNSSACFGENLKRLRRERFWSQDELAKRSGVARQTIYRYESGLSAPYARTVRALAEAFGLDPHELADPGEVAEEKQEKRATA